MTLDLPFELADVRDEVTPQRDGTVLRQRRYTFYLGKFGPFVERFDVGQDTAPVVQARVAALKQHLTLLQP